MRLMKVLVESGVQTLGFEPGVSRVENAPCRAHSRNLFLGEEGDRRRSQPEGKERIHSCHGEADDYAECRLEALLHRGWLKRQPPPELPRVAR